MILLEFRTHVFSVCVVRVCLDTKQHAALGCAKDSIHSLTSAAQTWIERFHQRTQGMGGTDTMRIGMGMGMGRGGPLLPLPPQKRVIRTPTSSNNNHSSLAEILANMQAQIPPRPTTQPTRPPPPPSIAAPAPAPPPPPISGGIPPSRIPRMSFLPPSLNANNNNNMTPQQANAFRQIMQVKMMRAKQLQKNSMKKLSFYKKHMGRLKESISKCPIANETQMQKYLLEIKLCKQDAQVELQKHHPGKNIPPGQLMAMDEREYIDLTRQWRSKHSERFGASNHPPPTRPPSAGNHSSGIPPIRTLAVRTAANLGGAAHAQAQAQSQTSQRPTMGFLNKCLQNSTSPEKVHEPLEYKREMEYMLSVLDSIFERIEKVRAVCVNTLKVNPPPLVDEIKRDFEHVKVFMSACLQNMLWSDNARATREAWEGVFVKPFRERQKKWRQRVYDLEKLVNTVQQKIIRMNSMARQWNASGGGIGRGRGRGRGFPMRGRGMARMSNARMNAIHAVSRGMTLGRNNPAGRWMPGGGGSRRLPPPG